MMLEAACEAQRADVAIKSHEELINSGGTLTPSILELLIKTLIKLNNLIDAWRVFESY